MTSFEFIPVLADLDAGDIGKIVVIGLMFLGWLVKMIVGNRAPQEMAEAPPPVRGPQERQLQKEIEKFLQEFSGKPAGEEPVDAVEFVEDDEAVLVSSAPAPTRRLVPSLEAEPVAQKPGTNIANRGSPASADLGRGVRQHVAQHMKEGRLTDQVERHLAPEVDKSVKAHLGSFSAEQPAAPTSAAELATPSRLRELLGDQSGLRQIVLANAILNRPKWPRRSR